MNWDWYSATVNSSADEALAVIVGAQDLATVYPSRGLYSYERGAEVRRGDRVLCRAFWGGVNGNDSVHLQTSGGGSGAVVDLIRRQWPTHRVSRADVREDWSHSKAWRWVSKIAVGVADEFEVGTSTVGDWISAKAGRTLYLGGKSSRVQVRVYEKGKQLGIDPNWVRLEAQVRPTGEGKSALSTVLPVDVMGATRWTRELAKRVGLPELDAVRVRDPWSPSDDEMAYRWCLQQYGGVLGRRAASLGGWKELGEEMQSLVKPVEG